MEEDPTIVELNIAHYRALLKLDLVDEKRATITQLLANARKALVRTATPAGPGAAS